MYKSHQHQVSMGEVHAGRLLCYIGVHVPILSLHIILLNQPIDVLLDVRHSQHTSAHGGFDDFRHQFLMTDGLATLHDPHYRSLAFEVAIFGYTFVCLLVLLFGLFQLHLIDLDAVLGVFKAGVDGEGVGVVDVFAFGMFGQRPKLGAGERL